MKTQTKAIVASVVVIALCLSAVSGITYSWFSDTEQADVEISTAKLELTMTIGDGTSQNYADNESTDLGTVASVDDTTKKVTITNLAANAKITIPYKAEYTSTIKVAYRTSIQVDSIDSLSDNDKNSILVNGQSLSGMVGGKMAVTDWIIMGAAATTTVIDENSIVISTSENYTQSSTENISLKIVGELYQANYASSVGTDGTATVGPSGEVQGEAVAESGAEPVTTSVNFNSATINGEPIEGKTIEIKSVASSGTDSAFQIGSSGAAIIQLSLSDGETAIDNPTFDKPVTIRATVPGDLTNGGTEVPNVAYIPGESADTGASQPVMVSYYVSGTGENAKTTVVFSTTHFSDFMIFGKYMPVFSETGLKLAFALELPTIIYNDITVENTIQLKDGGNYCLDLNSKSINSECTLFNASYTKGVSLTILGNGGSIDAYGTPQTMIVSSGYSTTFDLEVVGGSYNTKKINDAIVPGQFAFCLTGDNLLFNDVTIGSNDNPVYVGIWASFTNTGYLEIKNSTIISGTQFNKNTSSSDGGVGVYIGTVKTASIKNCNISSVHESGTAVEVKSGDVDIIDCTLSAIGFVTDFSEINHGGSGLGQSTLVINDGYSNTWKNPVDVTISGCTITNSSAAQGCKPVIIATDGYSAGKYGVNVTLSDGIEYVYGFTPAKNNSNDYQYAKPITIVTVDSNGDSTSQTFTHNDSSVA